MPNFADSLRASIEADARAHLGAQALPGTRRTIGRRRVTATVGYGAGSALAVGAVAVAAATLVGQEEPAPASAPLTSTSPEVEATVAYATVDLNEPRVGQAWDGRSFHCGSRAPVPTSEAQGFKAEFDYQGDGVFSQGSVDDAGEHTITATVSFGLDEELPTYLYEPQALFVQDGVVVAAAPSAVAREWQMTSNGWDATRFAHFTGIYDSCGEHERPTPLPGGEYQMYIVSKVTASEVEAAIDAAFAANVTLPPAEMLPVYRPGSYDCERPYNSEGMGRPLSCDVSVMPGASVDFDSATAQIPYESAAYKRDLDVTLVSAPITVQIDDYESPHAEQRGQLDEPFTAESAPMCGAEYSYAHGSELMAFTGQSLVDLVPGNTLDLGLWLSSPVWTEVTVDMPATARVWLMEEQLTPLEGDVGSAVTYHVAGWMDIAVRDAGPLTIDRYDGPQSSSFKVTDMSWCDGEQPEYIREGWMLAPFSLTDDAGTRDRTGPVQIVSGG